MSAFLASALLLSSVSAFSPASTFGRSVAKSFNLRAADDQVIPFISSKNLLTVIYRNRKLAK